MCLSWEHDQDHCSTRSKSNCSILENGKMCGGNHHKLLHVHGTVTNQEGVEFKDSFPLVESNSLQDTPDTNCDSNISLR